MTKRVIMSRAEAHRLLLRAVAPERSPAYFLADVPVVLVDPKHDLLATMADDDPDVAVHRGKERDAWRSLAEYERRLDRSPRMLVVLERDRSNA